MQNELTYRQPWIGNRGIETCFILLPPFLSLALIVAFPGLFRDGKEVPDAWWVVLILLIDVAHVYSTLYRTYLDPQLFRKYRWPLLLIPPTALAVGIFLYLAGPLLFWRILAYLAVFHFIRQQYGFLRIYSRKERMPRWARKIDNFTIYYATLYPLIYWHLGEERHFNWFVEGDFLRMPDGEVLKWATWLYWIMIAAYAGRELIEGIRNRYVNIPRFGILVGTILSWYFGIVYFNGDMAFTLLNVVSHGIPYMALIWLFGAKRYGAGSGVRHEGFRPGLLRKVFSGYGIILFLGIIFLLAYLEEGLWDMTVWKEHVNLFAAFHLVKTKPGEEWLIVLVPLLALPQVTHYIIDGVIWRKNAG